MLTHAADTTRRLLTDDPGVTPNSDGLPGLEQVKEIVGAFLVWGLVAAVAAVAIGAGVMAFGKVTSRPGYSETGKSTVLWAAIASIVIGAANAIVTFFSGVGEEVDATPTTFIYVVVTANDPDSAPPAARSLIGRHSVLTATAASEGG